MNFFITFLPELSQPVEQPADRRTGLIKIERFQQNFEVDLSQWSVSEYQEHWKSGLKTILEAERSCLITTFSVNDKCRIDFWLLSKNGESVLFTQEHLSLNSSQLDAFSDHPIEVVLQNYSGSPGGEKQVLALAEIEEFVNTCS